MSKLRNVRRRQWERNLRHHMALGRRSNPLMMVDEFGYLDWPLVLPKGYNRMTQRLERRLWANYRNTRRRDTDAQAAG